MGLCGFGRNQNRFHAGIGDIPEVQHQRLCALGDLRNLSGMLRHNRPGTDGQEAIGALVDGDGVGDAVDQGLIQSYGFANLSNCLQHGAFSPS